MVAFHARPAIDRYYDSVGDKIVYDHIYYNAGEAFDGTHFICPVTGLYLFSLSARGENDQTFEVRCIIKKHF